jgi:hypothetical protein
MMRDEVVRQGTGQVSEDRAQLRAVQRRQDLTAPVQYLDIGTNHRVVSNNTFLFYRTGSSGVCVEPNPAFANLIRR